MTTVLGWTINGPLREGDILTKKKATVAVSSSRISVAKLDDLWCQHFRYDFPESVVVFLHVFTIIIKVIVINKG